MLRNFDTEIDVAGTRQVHVSTPVVVVMETVTVTPRPSDARAFVAKDDAAWGWDDLRDYVVAAIEARFGVFPRDARKEASIFKSFLGRYDDRAIGIARYAFEQCDGFWAGAPISVNRFCKGSDVYFGDRIVVRLVDEPVRSW